MKWKISRRALSGALVTVLLAAAGIIIATVAIKFLTGAATAVNQTAAAKLDLALAELA